MTGSEFEIERKKRENSSGIMIAIGIGRNCSRSGDGLKKTVASMRKKGDASRANATK